MSVATTPAARRGIVTPEAVVLEFDTAGVPSRALARIIDVFAVGALFSLVSSFLTPVFIVSEGMGVVLVLLLGFLAVFGYPAACETVWGRTVGKAALGLRVLTEEGGPVRFRQAAIRSALQVVDFLIVPVGVVATLSAIASRHDQRLGDRLAGTLVVRSSAMSIRSQPVGFPALPGYEGYVERLDVGTISSERYELLRSYLTRVNDLTPEARQRLSVRLAAPTAALLGHTPPSTMHPEVFLASVAAAYQRRHGGPATWMWGPWAGGRAPVPNVTPVPMPSMVTRG